MAEIDLAAAGMAMLPAGTMAGVLAKVRAMAVPILRLVDGAIGALRQFTGVRRMNAPVARRALPGATAAVGAWAWRLRQVAADVAAMAERGGAAS